MQGGVLTNSLGRDEVAEVGAEEDEDKWEGHPHQELQRKVGLHLGVGPLVDWRHTLGSVPRGWEDTARPLHPTPCHTGQRARSIISPRLFHRISRDGTILIGCVSGRSELLEMPCSFQFPPLVGGGALATNHTGAGPAAQPPRFARN